MNPSTFEDCKRRSFPENGHHCGFVVLQRFSTEDWMRECDFMGVKGDLKGDRFRGMIDFPDHPFVAFMTGNS